MFQGKMKAITFSYDDGVTQDRRLIELLNKYGLKATFNLNSQLLGNPGSLVQEKGIVVNHTKVKPEEVKELYQGHEVAVHTLTHPNLTELEDEEVIRQVEEDRKRLSELVGYEVYGMAYPCGGVNNDDRVAKLIKENTKVRYSRTITSTGTFDLQDNLYRFHPTVFHRDWVEMEKLTDIFLHAEPTKPMLFYIWGHSYEFDALDDWGIFEEFCKKLSNREDVFYGTNREVFFGE